MKYYYGLSPFTSLSRRQVLSFYSKTKHKETKQSPAEYMARNPSNWWFGATYYKLLNVTLLSAAVGEGSGI